MADLLTPVPGFDQPLELLHACHQRIAAQCATLENLARHLPSHGSDEAAQQAAQTVLRYFDSAGIHHHQDEEVDLFPLLLAHEEPALAPLIEQLQEQHRIMDTAWQTLRPILAAIADATAATLDLAAAEHYGVLYRDHIAREEEDLLPLARQLLTGEQLAELGRKMAARRGVTLPPGCLFSA